MVPGESRVSYRTATLTTTKLDAAPPNARRNVLDSQWIWCFSKVHLWHLPRYTYIYNMNTRYMMLLLLYTCIAPKQVIVSYTKKGCSGAESWVLSTWCWVFEYWVWGVMPASCIRVSSPPGTSRVQAGYITGSRYHIIWWRFYSGSVWKITLS